MTLEHIAGYCIGGYLVAFVLFVIVDMTLSYRGRGIRDKRKRRPLR